MPADNNDNVPLADEHSTVGYRRPPAETRFKKGASGNPKGRPKGCLNVATALIKALRERVVINENGRRRTVTKLEAALKQLVNRAASGDLRALRQLIESARDAELKQQATHSTPASDDLDQQVMQGILQRFERSENSTQQITPSEVKDVDNDSD